MHKRFFFFLFMLHKCGNVEKWCGKVVGEILGKAKRRCEMQRLLNGYTMFSIGDISLLGELMDMQGGILGRKRTIVPSFFRKIRFPPGGTIKFSFGNSLKRG